MKNITAAWTLLLIVLSGILNLCALELDVRDISNKIKNAADPKGAFQNATSYIIRQKIIVYGGKEGEFKCEIKFKTPDMVKTSYYYHGKLMSEIIMKGNKTWRFSGSDGTTTEITGKELAKLHLFHKISSPKALLYEIFDEIKIDEQEVNGEKFYRLECITASEELPDIVFFIDAGSFLQRRMFTTNDKGEHYSAEIINYKIIENIFVPAETIVFSGGIKQKITLEDFILNPQIDDAEFAIPAKIEK